MSHVIAGYYFGTIINAVTSGSVTITGVNVGTGAGRAIQMMFTRRSDRFPVVTSVTIGGESMTIQGSDQPIPNDTTTSAWSSCLINPTVTGTQDLVITCTTTDAGNSPAPVMLEVIDGIDITQSAPVPTVNSGSSDTATVTQASEAGRQVVVAMTWQSPSLTPSSITPTGWTLPAENGNPTFGGGLGYVAGYTTGSTSVVADGEWLDEGTPISGNWVAMAFDYEPTPTVIPPTKTLVSLAGKNPVQFGSGPNIIILS